MTQKLIKKYIPYNVTKNFLKLGQKLRLLTGRLSNVFQVVSELYKKFDPYLNKSFVFFGHSIGSLIALEFTRFLRKNNVLKPKHLIVSGTKAPQVPLKRPIIHNLPDPKFIEEIRRYNGIPTDILEIQELMSIFLSIIRPDFSISETYQYTAEEALDCPITALGGIK